MPTTGSPAAAERQVLGSTRELEALRPEWEQLWRADPFATPFQSPQWLLPWWKHVGQGQLCALAWRDHEGALVGFAPLYVHTDGDGVRHLFPVGMGTTDYLAPLARPGRHGELAEALLAAIGNLPAAWDRFEFPQLPREAPLLAAAADTEVGAGEPSPVLPLTPTLDRILPSTLRNLRTSRHRAERAGTLAYECADAAAVPEFLAALAQLHASRWHARGLPGVLADAAVRAAHAEAAPQLQAAGMLRLYGLRLDGVLVAVVYALFDPVQAHRRHCYSYIGGFDPRHAFFSPGSLLLAHAIERAAAEGATAFDFLRGAEPYKYRWGAVDQAMFTLRRNARPAAPHPA